ncbi:MAG: metalloregulator ArsR/SmtB family transcription factor [Cyanobacteria bacterium P01_E01_bin.42]
MAKTLNRKNSAAALAPVADYFKMLSEVSRLQILNCLKSGEMNVSQLSEETGLGQANLSKHLKILTQAGILNRKPVGTSVYYEISDPMIFDLCELVCDRLSDRMQEQVDRLNQLKALGTLVK